LLREPTCHLRRQFLRTREDGNPVCLSVEQFAVPDPGVPVQRQPQDEHNVTAALAPIVWTQSLHDATLADP
jgi:hypothetical protein